MVSLTFLPCSEIPCISIYTDCPSVSHKVIASLLHEETCGVGGPSVNLEFFSFLSSLFLSSKGMWIDVLLISKKPDESLEFLSPLFLSLAFFLLRLIPSVLVGPPSSQGALLGKTAGSRQQGQQCVLKNFHFQIFILYFPQKIIKIRVFLKLCDSLRC